MATLSLDSEDAVALQQVLEAALHGLRVEIVHTDNRAFRKMLEDREQKLESLLVRVTKLVLAGPPQFPLEY